MTLAPTPYADVNAVLAELLFGLRQALGEQFVGLYLYGSLAAGDFDPQRSDVDFLAVTRSRLSPEMLSALETMHARITGSGLVFARRLEGVYIPLDLLRRYRREDAVHPYLGSGGAFYPAAQQDSDWIIQRFVLREHSVVVAGPSLHPWIDPVTPDDLRGAVRGFVRDWWAPMLARPDRLRDREYQAYAVLTFCRVMYTLRYGEIASKTASARWMRQAFAPRWASLIDCALAWPAGSQPDQYEQTLAMLRFVVHEITKKDDR